MAGCIHVAALLVHKDHVGRGGTRCVPDAGGVGERNQIFGLVQVSAGRSRPPVAFLITERTTLIDGRYLARSRLEVRHQFVTPGESGSGGLLILCSCSGWLCASSRGAGWLDFGRAIGVSRDFP